MKNIFLAIFFSFLAVFCFSMNNSLLQLSVTGEEEIQELRLFYRESELVETPSRYKEEVRKAPTHVEVIYRYDALDLGLTTVGDLLNTLPGIYNFTSARGPEAIWFRGLRNRRNDLSLILVDGIPIRELLYSHGPTDEEFSIENLSSIEVLYGPGSAQYGNNAFGGIVSIKTRSGKDIKGLEVNMGFGDFNTTKDSIIYGTSGQKWDFVAETDFYDTIGNGPRLTEWGALQFERDEPIRTGSLRMKYSYGSWTFTGYHNKYSYTYMMSDDYPPPDSRFDWRTTSFGVSYKGEYVSGKIYYNIFNNSSHYISRFSHGVPERQNDSFQDSRVYGGDFNVHFTLNKHDILIGSSIEVEFLQNIRDRRRYLLVNRPIETPFWANPITNNVIGFYGQDAIQIFDKLTLFAGARYDHHEQFGGQFNPRVAIVYNPNNSLGCKLIWSKAYRGPDYRELYVHTSTWTNGNPDLNPERISSIEAVTTYLHSSQSFELSLFRNSMNNLVEFVNGPTFKSGLYVNKGNEIFNGVEAEWRFEPPKSFSGFANISYIYAWDRMEERIVPNVARWMGKLGTTYKPTDDIHITLFLFGIGRRPLDISSGRDTLSIGGYLTVNGTISYINILPHFDLLFNVKNLTDKRAYDAFENITLEDTQKSGRMFLIQFRFHQK